MIPISKTNSKAIHNEHDEVEQVMCRHPRPTSPQGLITEIEMLWPNSHFALGDKVYYIHPDSLHTIRRSTIKKFEWKSRIPFLYNVLLDDGVTADSYRIFHTIDEARKQAIDNLECELRCDRNQLATLQRRIALNERLIARLNSHVIKNNNPK